MRRRPSGYAGGPSLLSTTSAASPRARGSMRCTGPWTCHAATASSVNQIVRLPRRASPASYSGQFVTRYLAFGILWRRLSLNLYGMGSTARGAFDGIVYRTVRPPTLLSVQVFERGT